MKHDHDFMEKITRDLEVHKAAVQILNFNDSFDINELKSAYRKAAIEYHPDHNGNTIEANKRFILIKCAYELLAFDKPCDELCQEFNALQDVPEDDKYKLDNPWGYFLWWRDKFFDTEKMKGKSNDSKHSFCI